MVFFTIVYLGGFGLLWYLTSWKILVAAVLIAWGTLMQVHMNYQRSDN